MLGSVCSTPTARITDSAARRLRSNASPSGSYGDGTGQGDPHEKKVPKGEAQNCAALSPEVGEDAGTGGLLGRRRLEWSGASQAETQQRRRSHPWNGDSINLDPPVEPPHVGLSEQSTQLGQDRKCSRGLALHSRAGECSRLVWREEVQIIVQDDQIVAGDESVGGVAIDHVHLPGGQCLIFHCRQECTHRAEAKAIGLFKTRQSVRPSDEVGGEPRP
jgi:hypothetical protein